MDEMPQGLSPVVSELDALVDDLDFIRARVASAEAMEAHLFAKVADLVLRRERERAETADTGARVNASQLAMREIYAEIGAALQLSEFQVQARVDQAYTLAHSFTETFYDLSDGRMSRQHAQAIVDAGVAIQDAAVQAEYERLARDMAAELTAAQLKIALGSVVDRLDPEGTQERIREAASRRAARVRTLEPGLSRFTLDGPTAQIEAVHNRITEIATEIQADNQAEAALHEAAEHDESAAGEHATVAHEAGGATDPSGGGREDGFVADERTRVQIAADVALDLLLTGSPAGHGATEERHAELGAITATVHITIPAATLAGTGTGGAGVIGAGPIDDETARRLAGDSDAWYRVFIDPATGVPVSVDKRRPCKAQKRLLRARDEWCRFPGCRRPARKADIDHTLAVADGGPTSIGNLAHLCERHHTMKHHTDWRVEQLSGGVLRFTAPTGRTHRTRPPSAVRFVPDRPPGSHGPRWPHDEPARDPAPF